MASSAHSPQKIKLCEHIVLQHFGSIAARVACLLLKRGRLTVRELSRFLNQPTTRSTRGPKDPFTSMSPGSTSAGTSAGTSSANDPNAPVPVPRHLVQQTLMTLIQHGCAWHSSTDPEIADPSQEFFEIDPDEVLGRLRFGRYIGIAEDVLGEDAARIVTTVLKHGKLQAKDIVDKVLAQVLPPEPEAAENQHLVNGHTNGDAKAGSKRKAPSADEELRAAAIRKQLARLLYHTYLRPSTLQQHVSPRDKEITYEARERRKISGIPTPKQLKEIRTKVRYMIAEERQKEWQVSEQDERAAPEDRSRRGLIRKSKSSLAAAAGAALAKKAKRAKTNSKDKKGRDKDANGVVNHDGQDEFDPADEFDIDMDVWLRAHYDRFDIHVRSEVMVDAIRAKYNSTVAEVFRHLIKSSEASSGVLSVRDEESAPVSLTLLAPKLPATLQLQKGFDRRSFGKDKASAPSRQEFLAEYCGILSNSDDLSGRGKETRFLSPAGDGQTKAASGRKVASSFRVDFKNTAERMRKDLLRTVVEEKFGTAAVRIMSILRDKGRLEEKHISKLALISISETRDICSRLFASSLLGLQEIPKTKDRDPSKTFFLWFVDEAKCRAWLLDHLYQTLARLGERRNEEMRRQAPLLRKVERTDVKMDTAGLLNEWERESWQRLETVLRTLTVAEQRTEMDVFVMRDLALTYYSQDTMA